MKTTIKTKQKPKTKVNISSNVPATVAQAHKAVSAMPAQTDATLIMIDRAARDKKVDVSKMREMLSMKIEYEKMLRQDAFQRDMILCQAEIPEIEKLSENKDNHSTFAKLEHIAKVIKPIYRKFGFTPTYTGRVEDGQKYIGAWLYHREGHKEYYELPGYIEDAGFRGGKNKTENQGLGAMVSYLRRYLLCMIFDIILIDEDKDGQRSKDAAAAPVNDKFTAPTGEAPPAEDEVWKPAHGVVIQGRTSRIDYDRSDDIQCVQAANYLKVVMGKRKHKQSRIDLINENTPLIRALVKAGKGSIVNEFHTLADKGEK